jgi:hypothetical protein
MGRQEQIIHLAGGTWSIAAAPAVPLALNSVALAPAGSAGWAVGLGGTLLHLADGTWSSVASPTTQDLYGVALLPAGTEGWAVRAGGTLLHLAHGTWIVVH